MEILKLAWPIEHEGSIIRAVTVRIVSREEIEERARDWQSWRLPDDLTKMVALISDLPIEFVDELDGSDIIRIGHLCAELKQRLQNEEITSRHAAAHSGPRRHGNAQGRRPTKGSRTQDR